MSKSFDEKSKNVLLFIIFISFLAIIAGIITSVLSKKDNIEDDTRKKLEKSTTFLEGIGIPFFVIACFAFFVIKAGESKKN